MAWLLSLIVVLLGPAPYGGCDEAYRYPGTDGWLWCQVHRG